MVVKKILVPVDLNESSTDVLQFGRVLADAYGASLHLLYALGYPVASPEAVEPQRRDAHRRLDALLNATDRDNRGATTCCRIGPPAHEIIRYATEEAIDLILMRTHCHGSPYHLALGSIAETVLRLAPCSVLALKAGAHASDAAVEAVPFTTSA